MRKFLISLSAMFAFLIMLFVGFWIFAIKTPDRYTNTYYGELTAKTERLESVTEKKIVFVGGSSLSFGINSKQLEEELGMPVVSYGLYASLGTKVMIDLSLHGINEGDIVILAPEINDETYSSFMGYDNILKCLENNGYSKYLSFKDRQALSYRYPKFIFEKRNMETPEEKEPYTKDSFNEYGDIKSELVINNILPDYYDASQMIIPNKDLITDDFVDMVNDYNKALNKKGATLYFGYSPTNELALDKTNLAEFEQALEEKLECKVLGSLETFAYNEWYFYDTNYHLNATGAILHTKAYAEALASAEKLSIIKEIITPEAPKPVYYEEPEETTVTIDGIVYNKGTLGYFVVGTDETGKAMNKITIPDSIEGLNVVSIEDEAFKDCTLLEELVIGKKINSIGNNCFDNCGNLTKIYLNTDDAPMIPTNGLLNGCNINVKVYIPSTKMKLYTSGYTWVKYKAYFIAY